MSLLLYIVFLHLFIVFEICQLLDVLESYCMAEGLDYNRLDGNTKSKERVQIVKEFNSSSHINLCLVSTMLVYSLGHCSVRIINTVCCIYFNFFFQTLICHQGRWSWS